MGDGRIRSISFDDQYEAATIEIPQDLLLQRGDNPLETIFKSVYRRFQDNYHDRSYLQSTAIVTPYNETVDFVNDYMLSLLPGEQKTYLSCDSLSKSASVSEEQEQLYPVEYLNSLSFSGFPSHKVELKNGAIIMLLRNINQAGGLCNGTRLIVTNLGRHIIEAEILNGNHVGNCTLIPRIKLVTREKKLPFMMIRKQYPIRLSYAMTINKSQGQTL